VERNTPASLGQAPASLVSMVKTQMRELLKIDSKRRVLRRSGRELCHEKSTKPESRTESAQGSLHQTCSALFSSGFN